jgi:hypothetical protein
MPNCTTSFLRVQSHFIKMSHILIHMFEVYISLQPEVLYNWNCPDAVYTV